MSFKSTRSFEKRKQETLTVLTKYPDRIPIICEKNSLSKTSVEIDKKKYLVPYDLTIGQFVYVIRQRLKLSAEVGIYIFINGMIPPSSAFITNIYEQHKDEDGFLYITYAFENTFG